MNGTCPSATGIPELFRTELPSLLRRMDPPATEAETSNATRVREQFYIRGGAGAYMVDIVRAFRAAQGAKRYIEVGSRDKGNIAWISQFLDPEAIIIDVDLVNISASEDALRETLHKTQRYSMIEGNSISPRTVDRVIHELDYNQADIVFLDSSHMYSHFLAEVELYLPLVRPGGLLLFHDCLWEGNEHGKGKAQAALAIDRFTPVYCVVMNLPVHRILMRESKLDCWGGVGVILKS